MLNYCAIEYLEDPSLNLSFLTRCDWLACRHLAYDANTVFNPAMDAHNNNAHTLSLAFSQLSAAAFTITARSKAGITANITDAQVCLFV